MARNRERPTDPEAERLHEVLSRLETDLTRELYTAMNDRGTMLRFKFAQDKIRTWERRHGGADFVEADAVGPANPNSERQALDHWFEYLDDIWNNRSLRALGSRKFETILDQVVNNHVQDRRERSRLKTVIRGYEEPLKALIIRRGAFELASLSNGYFPRNANEDKTVNKALEVNLQVILERFLAFNDRFSDYEPSDVTRNANTGRDVVLEPWTPYNEESEFELGRRPETIQVSESPGTSLADRAIMRTAVDDENDVSSALFADNSRADLPDETGDGDSFSFGSLLDEESPPRRDRARLPNAYDIDRLPTEIHRDEGDEDAEETLHEGDRRTGEDAEEHEPTELVAANWDSLWRELTKIYHHLHGAIPRIQDLLHSLSPEDALTEPTVAIETDVSNWEGLNSTISNRFDQIFGIIRRLQLMQLESADRTYLDNSIINPLQALQDALEHLNTEMIAVARQDERLREAADGDQELERQADQALRTDIITIQGNLNHAANGISLTLGKLSDFVEDLTLADRTE